LFSKKTYTAASDNSSEGSIMFETGQKSANMAYSHFVLGPFSREKEIWCFGGGEIMTRNRNPAANIGG